MDEKNNNKSESAFREERILKFWKENNVFQKSLEKEAPKGDFIFYEGPPTANGKPGIHHLEARAFKDAIPRYKTMRGYYVRRKAGWDTHGLPVELEVEKELGLKSKKEIEEFGIAEFNKRCKKSVWKYLDLWNAFTERIGFWVDQKNPYITYDKKYMESIWNVVKNIEDRKLLYKDYKVVPWCPRCGTALSSHELAQGYKDVKDLSVYIKFKIIGEEKTFALAWTTTPWTLLGNVALAVGSKIDYVKIKQGEEILILAKARLSVIEGEYEILEEIKGADLIGLRYESLYPYLEQNIKGAEADKMSKAFAIYGANFVTTEDGTGIVHTAVMYGADDFDLGTEIGLPKFHLVGEDGKFLSFAGSFAGRFVKDEETAVEIIKDLAHRGLLPKKEKFEHSYPHCWRCKTPLIYFARDSWYVRMSELRDKLVKENEKINWEPEYIKEGRFGEWLREVKDWAISRERYWGTPLPIWVCKKCNEKKVIGSVEDIKKGVKKSGNKYFVARHGEAICNVKQIISSKFDEKNLLTEVGRHEVIESIKKSGLKDIDLIFCSPMYRTKETAKIISETIFVDQSKIIFDDRLIELQTGDFNNKATDEYHKYSETMPDYFTTPFPNGESRLSVFKRIGEFIYEIENKYSGKNILIISHGDPIMNLYLLAEGFSRETIKEDQKKFNYFSVGEIREFNFSPIPHNEDYELDLHKPYIDEIKLECKCGGEMERVKEVMDVWFDSGTMPFSQDHYPFDMKDAELQYPADFISEATDQTRGWFYTLLAVGVLMGKGTPFKNVICLGHILDDKGKKMSKSIGNIVDPWTMIEKYGADTLRLWMYAVNQPGDSKNFDEKTVSELHRQVFGLLYNVLAFYELYRDKELENNNYPKSENVLDKWILAKLNELIELINKNLDNYKLLEPTRAIRDFIGDLSTWYLRRSRDSIKEGDTETKQTLYFVLKTLAKIMAPFAPFTAEDIWLKLKNEGDIESVHLAEWPKAEKLDQKIIDEMKKVRNIVSAGLEARQKAGIKVRQPLAKIEIKNLNLPLEYKELIKDELNVKEVIENKNIENEVLLDTEITLELKEEGNYRELLRGLQDLRKKMGFTPSDVITLSIETSEDGKKLISKFEKELLKTVLASKIEFQSNGGEEIKIENLVFKIKIEK